MTIGKVIAGAAGVYVVGAGVAFGLAKAFGLPTGQALKLSAGWPYWLGREAAYKVGLIRPASVPTVAAAGPNPIPFYQQSPGSLPAAAFPGRRIGN